MSTSIAMTGSFLVAPRRRYLAGTKFTSYHPIQAQTREGCQWKSRRSDGGNCIGRQGRQRLDRPVFAWALYCVVVEGLTIRQATPGDTSRIAELLGGDPGAEAIGLAGSPDKAIAFETGIVRLPNNPQGWRHTVVPSWTARSSASCKPAGIGKT